MKLRRLRAVLRKEILHILRDPRSLTMALAIPVLMLMLFGFALTLDVDRIPILVLDLDGSPESRSLISRFEGSRYFSVQGRVGDYSALERKIDSGQCLAGLVIPEDLSEAVSRGHRTEVQLLIDGTDSNTASIGLGYAQSLLADYTFVRQQDFLSRAAGFEVHPPVDVRLRVWYNSELKSKNYIVPGLIAVILMIIAALLTSLTVAREWEMGTMEQLLSTPIRPAELVLGKMGAYFILGTVDTLVAIGLGVLVFRIPLRGDLLLLAAGCFVFLAGALCWGILLSATVRSQLLAYQLGMITSFLPAFLLSGFIFSIDNMPEPIQLVTYVVPARYFISVLRGIFLKGVGLEVLGFEVLLLVLFASFVFWGATRKIKGKVA